MYYCNHIKPGQREETIVSLNAIPTQESCPWQSRVGGRGSARLPRALSQGQPTLPHRAARRATERRA